MTHKRSAKVVAGEATTGRLCGAPTHEAASYATDRVDCPACLTDLRRIEVIRRVRLTGKCAQCLAHPFAPVSCPHVIQEPPGSA